jgi:hypothetical protein
MTMTPTDHPSLRESSRALMAYLNALVGRESGGLLEVRWRYEDGMRRGVYRAADELPAAVRAILELGASTDVYVGCAPRTGRPGGLNAVARAWVLWADCDSPQAIAALQAFRPTPAILVRSGIIRSGQLERGCGRADRCWRHVISEGRLGSRGWSR